MRTYSKIDMIRFVKFCTEHPDLKPYEQIKLYDNSIRELIPKERLDSLKRALGFEVNTEEKLQ